MTPHQDTSGLLPKLIKNVLWLVDEMNVYWSIYSTLTNCLLWCLFVCLFVCFISIHTHNNLGKPLNSVILKWSLQTLIYKSSFILMFKLFYLVNRISLGVVDNKTTINLNLSKTLANVLKNNFKEFIFYRDMSGGPWDILLINSSFSCFLGTILHVWLVRQGLLYIDFTHMYIIYLLL